jgi:hypothetical protein
MNKKWICVALFLTVASLLVVNCGGGGAGIFAPEPTTTPTLPPPTPTPAPALGVPISKGGWQLTVEEVGTADSLQMGSAFGNSTTFTPKEGYAFLVVKVRIRNLDPTRSISITQENMAIIDKDGSIKTADGGGWGDENMCVGCVFSISQSVGSNSMSGWMLTQNNITFSGISPGATIRFAYVLRTEELDQEWKLQFQEIPPMTIQLGDKVSRPLSSRVESGASRLPDECAAENLQIAQTTSGIFFQAWEEDQLLVKFASPDGSQTLELCKGYAFNDLSISDDGAILLAAAPLQGWPNLYLLEPDGRLLTLAQNVINVDAAFVPGTKYAIFKVVQIRKDNPEIYTVDRETGAEKLLFEGTWANYRVFSNGYVLVEGYALDDTGLVERFGPLTAEELPPLPEGIASGNITKDGAHLLYTDYSGDKTILYYSAIDGSDKKELLSGDIHYSDKYVSPDGQYLLMADEGKSDTDKVQAVVINTATSDTTAITPEVDSVEYLFSPDGQWVAAVTSFDPNESDEENVQEHILYVFNVTEGKVVKEIPGDIVNQIFSPDNAFLAYTLMNDDETLTISVIQLADVSETALGTGILEGWNIGE